MASTSSIKQYDVSQVARHIVPSSEHLLLHDGKLTHPKITTKLFPHADFAFAFLSACQTATGDEDLSEEAVHLAAECWRQGIEV